jgi:hypothetical protein
MRGRWIAGWMSGAALAALVCVAACQLVFPTLLDEGGDAAPVDAAADTTSVTPDTTVPADAGHEAAPLADADAAGCNPALPPPPPPQGAPGSGSISFVSALRTLSGITPGDAGVLLGFDLDGVCTCPGPPSCRSPESPPQPNCDGPGGRDLQGNGLLELFDQAYASSNLGDILARINEGRITLLFYVGGYNGGPDDSQVTVAVYASNGLRVGDAGTIVVPKWDGTDPWSVDPGSFVASGTIDGGWVYTPAFVTTTAYVTQGTLVAELPEFVFQAGVGSITYRGAVVSAVIQPDGDGGYGLQGLLGARLTTHDIFTLMGQLKDANGQYLCGSNPTYQTLHTTVCQTADIMGSASADNMDASCNAVSVGAGFGTTAARLGMPFAVAAMASGCDGAVDDCTP